MSKILKKIICLIASVFISLFSVFSVSAEDVSPEYLKTTFGFDYDETEYPYYCIICPQSGGYSIFLSNQKSVYYKDNYLHHNGKAFTCYFNSENKAIIYETNTVIQGRYIETTSVICNYDILDEDGNVVIKQNADLPEPTELQTEPTEPSQTSVVESSSTLDQILLNSQYQSELMTITVALVAVIAVIILLYKFIRLFF